MKVRRVSELDRLLDDHFSSLPPFSRIRARVKKTASNWQAYAAALSSAAAMVTSASASAIDSAVLNVKGQSAACEAANGGQFASSQTTPMVKATRLAMAIQNAAALRTHSSDAPSGAIPAPVIAASGIVPVDSTNNTIQPGEWVSIYGSNLAAGTVTWNGDFPLSLGGTSVTINGKSAYVMYVSPGQINVQAPDDTATGQVSVVVTTPGGSATSYVALSNFAPSFALLSSTGSNAVFVAGIILRSDGSGAYGGGSYDVLGPGGDLLGYPTAPARPGDLVELFGFGFGPTNPAVPAGQVFSGAAPLSSAFTLYINNVAVQPNFVGLSGAGLYQVNLVVPDGVGQGSLTIEGLVGGMQTQASAIFPLLPGPMTYYTGTPGTYYYFAAAAPLDALPAPQPATCGAGGGRPAAKSGFHIPKLVFPPKS